MVYLGLRQFKPRNPFLRMYLIKVYISGFESVIFGRASVHGTMIYSGSSTNSDLLPILAPALTLRLFWLQLRLEPAGSGPKEKWQNARHFLDKT